MIQGHSSTNNRILFYSHDRIHLLGDDEQEVLPKTY